jgi:hypothetical protein
MTHEISASWDTLMKQAKDTGGDYFASAHRILEGSDLEYTAADVVALAKVMSDDFHSSSMGVAAQKLCEALTGIECGLDNVAEIVSESIDGVCTSIDGVGINVSSLKP